MRITDDGTVADTAADLTSAAPCGTWVTGGLDVLLDRAVASDGGFIRLTGTVT